MVDIKQVFNNYFGVFVKARPISLYVLFILLLTFMLNQLDRFVLQITNIQSARELEYGEKSCQKFTNGSKANADICALKINAEQDKCEAVLSNITSERICQYTYDGQGLEYQIISGPAFILVFTVMGIIVSIFADKFFNWRTYILAASLFFWSMMTFFSGFVNQYWQLALLRFGLGLGQAGCNPIATSLIADYFSLEIRGSALSVYNWGIYVGYSLSFAIGSQILKALNWRWVYYICGIPGFLVAPLIIFTIRPKKKEEEKNSDDENTDKLISNELNNRQKFSSVLMEFLKPSLILLCIAGSIRNAAGFVWGNNNNQYYKFMGEDADNISRYLGTIPIIFGIIGSFLGGFVSDQVAKKAGPAQRIWVLVISQIVAAPFAAGVLYFDPPTSYWFLIPTYIFGEMWIGVCLSVLVELVPEKLRITGVGVYFFIITNIGGNMQVLVPPVQKALEKSYNLNNIDAFRGALYIFYPGEYVVGSALFLLTLFVLKRDIAKTRAVRENSVMPETSPTSSGVIHGNKVFTDSQGSDEPQKSNL